MVQIVSKCEQPAHVSGLPQASASNQSLSTKPNTYNLSSPYTLAILNAGAAFKSPLSSSGTNIPGSDAKKGPVHVKREPLYDPANGLLLPRPSGVSDEDQKNITDVVVDPKLSKSLREHQKKGVSFMYECVMGWRHNYGNGCILADEMGLGKTLQCISLIWTVLCQDPLQSSSHGRLKSIAKRVIIIAPAGLVKNWIAEFKKWLGDPYLIPYAIQGKNSVSEFKSFQSTSQHRMGKLLILSYEQAVKNADDLRSIEFDLLICDEGHRLKNEKSKTYTCLRDCINTDRRIILTGTPIQNNLKELYAIINFVNPNALGSLSKFERTFIRPITLANEADATAELRETGESVQAQLNDILNEFMLRRTSDALSDFLPRRTEYIICCRPFDIQIDLYKNLILGATQYTSRSECIFEMINKLRKVCNHPRLVTMKEDDETNDSENLLTEAVRNALKSAINKSITETSSKLAVLDKMLTFIKNHTTERVVVVSNFTRTLDILEELCKKRSFSFLRIDGSVASSKRQEMVTQFNHPSKAPFIMLLSTKAGGVGLNLIGASRLISFDMDWNPAHDIQARGRIWRDGQRRNVHIYSLLTTGTIEEKIFQRQIAKQGLAGVVGDGNQSTKFTDDDLKQLFTLDEETASSTHDSIACDCGSTNADDKGVSPPPKKKAKKNNQFDLFDDDEDSTDNTSESVRHAEIKNWQHFFGEDLKEDVFECIPATGGQVSFIFRTCKEDNKLPTDDSPSND